MSLAPLTDEQLQAARARATAARRERAEAKQQLRDRTVALGDLLDRARSSEALAQLRVLDVLKCLPRVGDKRARALMDRLDIAENRRLRGLGQHQVAKLKEAFGDQ